ncbi:hypothetical protein GCM10027064_15370 [Microbacterium petrolearium]
MPIYLDRDGSQSLVRLGHFVQLRGTPSSAQFRTYFYNRVEGTSSVRIVSYQYGPETELLDDRESRGVELGGLARGRVPTASRRPSSGPRAKSSRGWGCRCSKMIHGGTREGQQSGRSTGFLVS